MTDTYLAPADPPDPCAAALHHLVRQPEAVTGTRYRGPLQDLASLLDAEGVFTHLSWPDARTVAATIAFDAITEDHPEVVLRDRARVLAADDWHDPGRVAHALTAAATVMELM